MSEQLPFAGKVALVTGASSGIGLATSKLLAQRGADVAMNYWTLAEAAQQAADQMRQLGRRPMLFPVDVSQQDAVEAMVDQIVAELGHIDLLVTSAVYSDREPFHTADMAGFRRTIDVSMWGAFYALRAVAKHLIRQGTGGSVVVVSSPHAHIAFPNCMAYNMAKAAIDQMARSAAMELLPHKVRVNIIYPGWTDTPGERKFFSEEMLQKASKAQPMGRLARPEEIAEGIAFLLSDAAAYMTGSTLAMDGGISLPFWSRRGTGDF